MGLLNSNIAIFIYLAFAALITPATQIPTQSVFNVISGTNAGSCDAYLSVIGPALQEVIDMSQAAIDDLNSALANPSVIPPTGNARASRKRIVRTLRQFYGIQFTENRLKIQDTTSTTTIRDNFQKIIDFTKAGMSTWRLACGDQWLQPTDIILPGTGDVVNPAGTLIPVQEGTLISDLPPGVFEGTDFVFWDATSRTYLNPQDVKNKADPPVAPGRAGIFANDPREGAFTMRERSIITFNPNTFGTIPASDGKPARSLKSSVKQYTGAGSITDATPRLDDYYAVTSLFLHEMTHQLFGTNDIVGYGFENCGNQPAGAITNADTYALYATASYLNNYDWHMGTGTPSTP